MAGENDAMMAEVMNLLEAEPASLPCSRPRHSCTLRAACDFGFYWQMQRSNWRESHTRTSEAAGRQRCHEALQKVPDRNPD